MKRKYKADESELKTVEDIRNQRREELKQAESVDDILAAEAQQEQRRKPAATGKARGAPPEPPTIIVCHIDPDDPATYGLDNQHRPEPVITAAEPPPEPLVYIAPDPDLHPPSGVWVNPRPFGDTPFREAPRVPLVALCQQLVRDHGPLTIDEMIVEIWGSDAVGTDDARWLKAQLCKWLTAAAKESGEQFYPKRHRNPARPNARLHRWGFWAEQQPPDRRYVVHNTEVLTAIAELKTELVTLRQVQSELLQRQNLLKEGFAAMLEKLTWNGEL